MKRIISTLTLLLVIGSSQAQNTVNYKITKDAPGLGDISNLYIAPKFILDIPFYSTQLEDPTDAMTNFTLGIGLRTHAILFEKFLADVNMDLAYDIMGDGRYRLFELGGGMIINSKTKKKNIKIILDSKETSKTKVAFENKERVTYSETYIEVPGTKHTFQALRGGVLSMRSSFDGRITDIGNARGFTSSTGIYADIMKGSVTNIAIQENSGRRSAAEGYFRYYADLLLAGNSHTLTKGTGEVSGSPLGFRAGYDLMKPAAGGAKRYMNIELGYRPGLNGMYIQFGIGFQFRTKISAFDAKPKQVTES